MTVATPAERMGGTRQTQILRYAQDDTREVCLIGRGVRGRDGETKATTPLKPTAGFHPSEPSLAGVPGLIWDTRDTG